MKLTQDLTSSRVATSILFAAGLTFLAAGCGEDDATGTQQGQVTATVSDDPSSGVVATSRSSDPANQSLLAFSGSMTADARVQMSADGSTWVDLDSPRNVDLSLQSSGSATTVHSSADLSTGTYAHIRLVLSNADATVASGSTIGNTTLSADVQVSIGSGGQVIIEKQVEPITVSADSETTLVFDLNSEVWVTEDNVQAQAVSESEIASATSVVVQ